MFGLDLKTAIITAIFIIFILPWIRSALLNASAKTTAKAPQ
jgi:hypothetical protein